MPQLDPTLEANGEDEQQAQPLGESRREFEVRPHPRRHQAQQEEEDGWCG